MKFGPDGMEETTEYDELTYHDGMMRFSMLKDYDSYYGENPVTKSAVAIMKGEDVDVAESPYEIMAIIKDASIMKGAVLLREFANLYPNTPDNDPKMNMDALSQILLLSGIAVEETKNMNNVLLKIKDFAKDDNVMLGYLYVTMDAVHTYALMDAMVKDLIMKKPS